MNPHCKDGIRGCVALTSLLLAGVAISDRARASPIQYRFSWEGSAVLEQSYANLVATVRVVGRPGEVISYPSNGATGAVNGFSQPLAGQFSSGDVLGSVSSLQVELQHSPGFSTFNLHTASSVPYSFEVASYATGFPGIGSYDLRSAFGPVSGVAPNGSTTGAIYGGLDIGGGRTMTFANAHDATFAASTPTNDAIYYDFSWNGAATLSQQLANAHFSVTLLADTDDVISYVSNLSGTMGAISGATNPLVGQFSSGDIFGSVYPLQVELEPSLNFATFNLHSASSLPFAFELAGYPTGFPGIDSYDLRSAFGPVSGISPDGFHTGFISGDLDIGGGRMMRFADARNVTFEAIGMGAAGVPEPASLGLLFLGLVGLAAARRQSRAEMGPLPEVSPRMSQCEQ